MSVTAINDHTRGHALRRQTATKKINLRDFFTVNAGGHVFDPLQITFTNGKNLCVVYRGKEVRINLSETFIRGRGAEYAIGNALMDKIESNPIVISGLNAQGIALKVTYIDQQEVAAVRRHVPDIEELSAIEISVPVKEGYKLVCMGREVHNNRHDNPGLKLTCIRIFENDRQLARVSIDGRKNPDAIRAEPKDHEIHYEYNDSSTNVRSHEMVSWHDMRQASAFSTDAFGVLLATFLLSEWEVAEEVVSKIDAIRGELNAAFCKAMPIAHSFALSSGKGAGARR